MQGREYYRLDVETETGMKQTYKQNGREEGCENYQR